MELIKGIRLYRGKEFEVYFNKNIILELFFENGKYIACVGFQGWMEHNEITKEQFDKLVNE